VEEEMPGSVCSRIPSELVQFGHELLRAMKHLPDPERASVREVAHDGPFVWARMLRIQRCRFGTREVVDEEDVVRLELAGNLGGLGGLIERNGLAPPASSAQVACGNFSCQ
jgi:hypothetical protein